MGLVLTAALSVHSGAAVAALAFSAVGALGVVSLRIAISAVALLVLCRPRLRGHSRADWLTVVGFGVVLAGMSTLIYESFSRIPLGVAITLEVLGPLALSVVAGRRLASWLCALVALGGVALLGKGGVGDLDLVGVAFALAAGAMWAGYILFSSRTGSRFPKSDGLAIAMSVATVLTLPLGISAAGPALLAPGTVLIGAVVALMSSVLPYTLEMRALRTMPPGTFAVLTALGPALAAVAGYVVLGQDLARLQVLGIGLVIAASVGAVRSATAPGPGAGPAARPRRRSVPTSRRRSSTSARRS
jgi:inner membrane transporter RhtA